MKDRVAGIYGAGGAVGSVVARAFAREGGQAFSHRTPPNLERNRAPA
jgi:NAD(P)-dependent dehydrogenase (short-subunit alcohol dehydrogenase family)